MKEVNVSIKFEFYCLNDEFEHFGALKYSNPWSSSFTCGYWNILKSYRKYCIGR